MKYWFLYWLLPLQLLGQEVEVFSERTDSTINFYARSPYYCHYTVEIKFDAFENMQSSLPVPATLVIEPRATKQFLLSVWQKEKSKAWKYKFNYRFDQGDLPNTKHDDAYAYYLPYSSPRSHTLVQGYFGKFSHANTHALDFEMPEGTTIIAARDGVVIKTKYDSNVGGTSPEFIDKGNYVLIYHDDGTFGSYFHLKQNGVKVNIGQQVKRGEVIGISGNTGWSSAPHLHFEVLLPSNGVKLTVPTKFLLKNGQVESLQEGKSYR